jgi:PRTRC genetic system protein E
LTFVFGYSETTCRGPFLSDVSIQNADGACENKHLCHQGGSVFVELMPLLAGRTVLITVAKVDDKTLRVNVIPRAKADENPALSTPLTYTGSPEELDAELGKHLADYAQVHQQTGSTLAEAKATMEAAAKAVQEEAKRKAEERKKTTQKPPATPTAEPTAAPPSTPEPLPLSPSVGTLGLFPATVPEPTTTQSKGGLAL